MEIVSVTYAFDKGGFENSFASSEIVFSAMFSK